MDRVYTRVDYSETGYALWICAPTAEVTADNRSRYRNDFGGTSSAAAVVSGVAALVRSANTSLTWRDVKLLLAASARRNDWANSGWEEGALEYGSETERYFYNPEYGFGVVDAKAAVDLAESWTNLPPMETSRVRSGEMELTIPDASDGAASTTVSSRLTLGPEVGFTEFVEVHIHFDHPSFRDLEVELQSPAGTVSKLAVPYEGARERELRTTFRFGSARHLGEDPSGEWTLKVTDHLAEQEGSIRWWGIKVYGHGEGAGTQKATNSPATGAPTISGTVRVGETLSADISGVDDWNELSAATFSYQWIRNDRTTGTDTDIPAATEATYTLVAEDEGNAVKVRVTFTDAAGYLENLTSTATEPVEARSIHISGTVRVGETLSADISGVDDWNELSGATFSYQWIRNDRTTGTDTDIPGATEATYTLVAEDEGHAVKVRVTFTDNAGYLDTLTSTATKAVGPLPLQGFCDRTQQVRDGILRMIRGVSDCSKVSISSLDRVRGELVLTRKGITALQAGDFQGLSNVKKLRLDQNDLETLPEGVFEGLTALRVVWLHSNPGAPFTLTVDLERRSNTAVAARVAQGAPFDIEATLLATGGALSSTTVTIRGGSTSSDEITVIPDGDAPVTVSVVSASFRLKNRVAPVGINVRTGGPVTLTEGNTLATGAPSITGTVQVGETLTADTSDIADQDGLTNVGYTYQWMAAAADIRGATGRTYTLEKTDLGKSIKVRVSFTDDAGNEEELTSEATGAVTARPNSPATGLPTISGAAQVGETFAADTSGINDADGLTDVGFSYQWIRNDGTTDTDISGATGETYTLLEADQGKSIKVRVSFTDDAGNEEELTSEATGAVLARPNSPATGAPAIIGTVQVGETLTADTSGIADANGLTNVSYNYQWLADDAEIARATGWTYTLEEADEGKAIRVQVSFTDDAGNNETLTSEATEPVTSASTEPVFGDGPPGAPRNLTATAGDQEITLSWEPPADNGNAPATRYRIEWRIDGKDYTRSQWGTSGKTTYTKTDLGNGVKYVFRVKAENGTGNYGPYGPASEEVSATPTSGSAVDLGTPVLSNTKTLHHGMVKLDWEDIEDAGWYVVQYYHIDGGSGEWMDLPAAEVDVAFHGSSAVVSNLDWGIKWVRVRAASCAGSSEWSQIEELYVNRASDWEGVPVPEVAEGDEIEPCPVVLGTPVLSNTKTLHHGMVRLDWEDIEDAGWYVVQYYHIDGGSGEWLDLPAAEVDVAFHGSSAVVSNLDWGIKWVRVRAASCAGSSEWSQIEELYVNRASDWEGVPVPEVEEGDEIEPCSEDADTPDNSPATGAPAISGTAQVGETLTANTSGIADPDGLGSVQYEYQWLADDSEIAGATGSTYTLADSDEGKTVRVQASFTDDAGNEETLTSGATEAVAAEPQTNSPATGAPTISGTTQVGETLTVETSGVIDADGLSNVQYEYQWLADDADIAGATGSTYTLTDSEESKAITVQVSFTDEADNEETLTSAATAAVAGAQPTEPPARPRGLSATSSHDSVTLTWDDPDDDSITGYVILRRIPGVDPQGHFDELVANTGTAATTYTDDTVSAETRYTYRIKAINGAGTSERSRWYHIDTPAAPVPDRPTGLEATESHGQVVLTWDDPGDESITGYVILRRVRVNNTGGDFSVLVADTGTAATTYTDNTVAASTTYTYRIKAINEHGTSERSSWYHIDTPSAP